MDAQSGQYTWGPAFSKATNHLQSRHQGVGRQRTGHDDKDLAHELQVVRLVELRRVLAALEHDQQLQQQVQACTNAAAAGRPGEPQTLCLCMVQGRSA